MASAIEAQGTLLQFSNGSPTEFVTIGNVVGFSGPGGGAAVIDITNLASEAKEKLMGLPDEGQFTLDVNFDYSVASHSSLIAARKARTRSEFKITFTDSGDAVATFFGYVLNFSISGAVDAAVKASVTIEIDGPVAWTA